ncbi:MAG: 2-C-methyl-D-erythritol 4-phosphate cytidylyltransferase [bacterium]
MTAGPEATAVIAAAGSGERLGADLPKALVEIAGRPMVAWSLDAFAGAATVGFVVIAAPPGRERELEALAPPQLAVSVVTGGAGRSHSVALALAEVEAGLVAIHDAARPLVSSALVDELVTALASRPDLTGVIAAAPILDTVKRAAQARPGAGGGFTIAATENRDLLWAAQTPQVFRIAALREALAGDPDLLTIATDDAALVERAGGSVLLHPSPATNLKVTTVADLRLAESLLS